MNFEKTERTKIKHKLKKLVASVLVASSVMAYVVPVIPSVQKLFTTAYADVNTDISGGVVDGVTNATGNFRYDGQYGARINIYDKKTGQRLNSSNVDIVNGAQWESSCLWFGNNKIEFKNKIPKNSTYENNEFKNLEGEAPYKSFKSKGTMPKTVATNGGTDEKALREYFSDTGVLTDIFKNAGLQVKGTTISDEELAGKVLVIEPLAKIKYQGKNVVVTGMEGIAWALESKALGKFSWDGSTWTAGFPWMSNVGRIFPAILAGINTTKLHPAYAENIRIEPWTKTTNFSVPSEDFPTWGNMIPSGAVQPQGAPPLMQNNHRYLLVGGGPGYSRSLLTFLGYNYDRWNLKEAGIGCGILDLDELNPQQSTIKVVKKGNDGKLLEGAEFNVKFSQDDVYGKTQNYSINYTTNSQGYFEIENIKDNTGLTITETKPPKDYSILQKETKITKTKEPQTITIMNEKVKKPTPPIDVDYMIKEDELTRSFHRNLGPADWLGGSSFSGSLPSKSCYKNKSYTKTYTKTDGTTGKSTVWYHDDCGRGYNTKWNEKLTVHKKAFHSPLIFNSDSAAEVLKQYRIVHDSNCANLLYDFNIKSDFTHNGSNWNKNIFQDAQNAFTYVDWISHRTGINNDKSGEIPLAKYMESDNNNYIDFANKTFGAPKQAYKEPQSSGSNYGTGQFQITTSHGGNNTATAEAVETWHCASSAGKKHNVTGNVTTSKLNFKVGAEATHTENNKSNILSGFSKMITKVKGSTKWAQKNEKNVDKNSNGSKSWMPDTIKMYVPSETFSFFPTYKMKYTDTLNVEPKKEAYMLATGQRTFQGTDYAVVHFFKPNKNQADTYPMSQWSRDKIDNETGEYADIFGIPVTKSGMALQAVTNDVSSANNQLKVRVEGLFLFQDTNFVDEADRASVNAKNIKAYNRSKQLVDDLVNKISDKNNWGYYSNMWDSTSVNAPDALKVNRPNGVRDDNSNGKDKTHFVVKDFKAVVGNRQHLAYALDANNKNNFTGSHNTNINGTRFTFDGNARNGSSIYENITTQWQKGEDRFGDLLVDLGEAPGYEDWYEEDYEGLMVGYISQVVTINDMSSDWVQVHSHLSDWRSLMNDEAQELSVTLPTLDGTYNVDLIKKITSDVKYKNRELNMNTFAFRKTIPFGVGRFFNAGQISYGGYSYPSNDGFYVPLSPSYFGIRGSVYDLT